MHQFIICRFDILCSLVINNLVYLFQLDYTYNNILFKRNKLPAFNHLLMATKRKEFIKVILIIFIYKQILILVPVHISDYIESTMFKMSSNCFKFDKDFSSA